MDEDNRQSFAPTLRIAMVIVVIGVLLWVLSDIVLLLFSAILLAVLLRGGAQALARVTGLAVNIALGLVTLAIVTGVVGFGILFGPRFVSEGQQLVKETYSYVQHLRQHYGHTEWGQVIEHAVSAHGTTNFGPFAPKLLSVTFGTVGGLGLLIATGLYLAISPEVYINGTVLLLPPFYRKRGFAIFAELGKVLRYWMLGQLIDMAVVGILSTAGLFLLHVPLPLALGLLAGFLTFVPYLGAILAGIPAVIVASTVSAATVLWVIALYFVCHIVEGYVVAPVVSRRTVRLPPAITLLSISAFGEVYGLFGALIATPLAAAVIVLIHEIYIRDMLGDSPHLEN
jgi:predicted PurR-regulated permease PerM